MDAFILALFHHSDKLRPSTVYQILSGKRTSSVLSYAFFYDRLGVFQAMPNLEEKEFTERVNALIAAKQLESDEDGYLQTTVSVPSKEAAICSHLNYFQFGRRGEQMWRLVQLLVQAAAFQDISNRYVPVENTPMFTEPVRQLIRQHPQLKQDLFTELWQVFEQLPPAYADFLVGTLSGPEVIGQTFFQLLPEDYQKMPWRQLFSAAAIHCFLSVAKAQSPLLAAGLKPFYQENLNQSMLKTRRLFLSGQSIEEIMEQRQIKRGTVNDHLIEWAIIDEQFPYQAFASQYPFPPLAWKLPYQVLKQEVPLDFLSIRINQIAQKRGILC
ncbi:helix-turn-helix domain-containing protein [Enterococcus sp.]|uniref:helix-turn-helix domain-containing protein n=1 Tax=Enterococcus sp. TaxID=35783 RepID=UPI0025C0EF08|nr:helix-turn-helix domain-containing protein [Enterococcus sp.]